MLCAAYELNKWYPWVASTLQLFYASCLLEFRPQHGWMPQRKLCTVPGIQQALNTRWWQKAWSLSGCWHLLLDILDVQPRSWFNSLSLNFVDWNSLLYCFDSCFLRLLRSLREERHGLHVNSDFFQPRSLLLKVWSGDQQYWQHRGTCSKYGIPAPSEPSESESVF